jgi:hypothetical protein
VFERFYKGDPSRTGAGTGLGLAICKHLILAHGGRIWAESGGVGQGATFRFTVRRLGADVQNGLLPHPSTTAGRKKEVVSRDELGWANSEST